MTIWFFLLVLLVWCKNNLENLNCYVLFFVKLKGVLYFLFLKLHFIYNRPCTLHMKRIVVKRMKIVKVNSCHINIQCLWFLILLLNWLDYFTESFVLWIPCFADYSRLRKQRDLQSAAVTRFSSCLWHKRGVIVPGVPSGDRGIRIVAWPKPRMFCEESLRKIKFVAFPKCVGPRILSLESVDYFGTSEHYWVVE